jgi:2-succinyl-6-hydroxy-2,4-cyclohexadiene-1-carboxylate synthase
MLECENANVYYDERGTGEPLILLHGFTVSSEYWIKTGVALKLAERYRVITMDLRGHGQSAPTASPHGYNARAIGEDLDTLADALNLSSFHLLGHSTGGIVAARYAMRRHDRLSGLMLLSASSATSLVPQYDPQARRRFADAFSKQFRAGGWEEIIAAFHDQPGPLLEGMERHPDGQRLWGTYEQLIQANNPLALAVFAQSFFWDPDFRREQLRRISCPTLVMVGEHDTTFLEPSKVLAEEIPGSRLVILDDVGHLLGLEAPDRTVAEILNFLQDPRQPATAPPPETPPPSEPSQEDNEGE